MIEVTVGFNGSGAGSRSPMGDEDRLLSPKVGVHDSTVSDLKEGKVRDLKMEGDRR